MERYTIVIQPTTFTYVEGNRASLFDIFLAVQKGFVNGSSIIFLIYFACYAVNVIVETGSMHAAIGSLLRFSKGRENLVIPMFVLIFSFAGSTYGEWDTVYGLIPIFVGVSIALGYDAIVGLGISGMSVAVGFASATTNPFTVAIAQGIAELPINSGLWYRIICYIVFVSITIAYLMNYAAKIKKDPSKSIVSDIDYSDYKLSDEALEKPFSGKEKLTMLILFGGIGGIVFGTLKWGWFLDEISAAFLLMGVIVSILWKIPPSEMAKDLIKSTKMVLVAGFVVGMSRGVLIMLQDSLILDTIIYSMYQPLSKMPKWLAAEGMLVLQTIINFFIPSGSGQAAATMPIMTPLADSLGISRQLTVLIFQFGDGFSNILWPTGSVFVMSSLAGIPVDRWYKFFLKFFALLFVIQSIFIYIGLIINY